MRHKPIDPVVWIVVVFLIFFAGMIIATETKITSRKAKEASVHSAGMFGTTQSGMFVGLTQPRDGIYEVTLCDKTSGGWISCETVEISKDYDAGDR